MMDRPDVVDALMSLRTAVGDDAAGRDALGDLTRYVTALESVLDRLQNAGHDAWGMMRAGEPPVTPFQRLVMTVDEDDVGPAAWHSMQVKLPETIHHMHTKVRRHV